MTRKQPTDGTDNGNDSLTRSNFPALLILANLLCSALTRCALRYEYCTGVEDFLARRTRLAFLDTRAAEQALPRVVQILGKELRWGWYRRRKELAKGRDMLKTFSQGTV